MKIIGLTGQSGAGKGTVASILEKHGIPHIDCDAVYHLMLTEDGECTNALTKHFGEKILSKDGTVDRKKLADAVFHGEGHEKKLAQLNKITHSLVLKKCRDMLQEYKNQGKLAVAVDAPALFESGFDRECDIILSVTAPLEIRLERIMKRDGISRQKVLERFSAQKSEAFFIENSDYVIKNASEKKELEKSIQKFIGEKLS